MITISFYGMDAYNSVSITSKLQKKLEEIYDVKEEQLEFFAPDSYIIYNGIEQTSFRLNVTVEAPYGNEDKEADCRDALLDVLKEFAIHIRILFTYFDPEREYLSFDETYPLHMSDHNMVHVETPEDDLAIPHPDYDEEEDDATRGYEEPYMGDIISDFDQYIKAHPDADNEEVYKALTEIRDKVTKEHKENKK